MKEQTETSTGRGSGRTPRAQDAATGADAQGKTFYAAIARL
ncbi:MAG: hypothetical protein ACRDKW_00405 [Actinomycetota bacterium]